MDIVTTGPPLQDLFAQLPTLPPKAQLERILELLVATDDCQEKLERLTSMAWTYLVDNQLWRAKFLTEDQVKEQVDWPAISERIASFQRSQARKEREFRGIVRAWGCQPSEVLGVELWPEEPSLHLLRHINHLSKMCASPVEAHSLLEEAVKRRISAGRLGRWTASPRVSIADVTSCLEQLGPKSKDMDLGAAQAETEHAAEPEIDPTDTKERDKPGEQPNPAKRTTRVSRKGGSLRPSCRCPPDLSKLVPGPGINLGDEQGLALLSQARKAGLEAMCQPHLRLLAARALGLHNNKSRETICRRLDLVFRHRLKLQKLKVRKSGWFRRDRRPAVAQDLLGVSRHLPVARAEFSFEELQIFERFAGPDSWQAWKRDGTINVEAVFSYLDLPDLREMIDTEFGIYRHHHRTLPGTSRLGWLRNMYYSLVQQLARQDPVWYALTVAARPDKHWRLVSYPYITKDTGTGGEATGFLHMDLDLEAFLADGRGGSRLTSSFSLDNEDREGCTVVVKGFHHHLTQWAQALQQRGWKGSGPTTNCSGIYTAEDQAQWGRAEGVPCPAWGIRITLPQLIHGSTPKSVRRRRTILPWFMAISEDHEQLEIPGCASWSEIRDCHLDLVAAERDPSGYGHRLGALKEKFRGSVVLGSSSALGDALLGRRKWTDIEVLWERDILLGSNCQAAHRYVQRVRATLVEQYRKAFSTMARAEREEFGDASYFVAEPLGVECDNGSDDYSMGSLGSGCSSDDE